MKKMIFVMMIIGMASLTGCSSNEKVNKTEENSIKPITVEEIQVEEIITENIIEEEIITEKYIDNEYLSELSYNSKRNSWN